MIGARQSLTLCRNITENFWLIRGSKFVASVLHNVPQPCQKNKNKTKEINNVQEIYQSVSKSLQQTWAGKQPCGKLAVYFHRLSVYIGLNVDLMIKQTTRTKKTQLRNFSLRIKSAFAILGKVNDIFDSHYCVWTPSQWSKELCVYIIMFEIIVA